MREISYISIFAVIDRYGTGGARVRRCGRGIFHTPRVDQDASARPYRNRVPGKKTQLSDPARMQAASCVLRGKLVGWVLERAACRAWCCLLVLDAG